MSDSDIEIYDDFLTPEEFENIEKYFLDYNVGLEGESVPWYWVNGVTTIGDGNMQFVSLAYANMQISNMTMWMVLLPIIKRIKPLAVYRIKANLTISGNIQPIDPDQAMHVDHDYCTARPGVMTTGIFYVNTNNGYTLFEDGTKVDSVANRFLVFPGHKKHAGMPFTDDSGKRIVINFNWFA